MMMEIVGVILNFCNWNTLFRQPLSIEESQVDKWLDLSCFRFTRELLSSQRICAGRVSSFSYMNGDVHMYSSFVMYPVVSFCNVIVVVM